MQKAQLGVGRVRMKDGRDEKYLISDLLEVDFDNLKTASDGGYKYWWDSGWWGNQGSTPQCVAYAWMHWLEDGPITHFYEDRNFDPWYTDEDQQCLFEPRDIYTEAQKRDRWPGENYAGTSVRAGAKVLKDRGVIAEYRWGWTLDDLVQAVLNFGPVVVGSYWYEDMYYPDEDGFVQASGRKVGGHAYVVNGINLKEGKARIKNSWSRNWGNEGHCWIRLDPDMKRLVEGGGEVCLATEKRLKE